MHRVRTPEENRASAPVGGFAARSTAGLVVVALLGVVFALALTAVAARWQPLQRADEGVVDAVNTFVHDRPWLVSALHFITDLGGAWVLWLLTIMAIVYLLVRRLPRLATYVAVTGLGALVLTEGVKALVGRVRPLVDVQLATVPDASFPSGHTLGSTVTYGMLLLVFLPAVPARARRPVLVGTVALVFAIGLSRIALGVHFPSDVVGGWALGLLWLTATGVAFDRWRRDDRLGGVHPAEGLEPEQHARIEPAPVHDRPVPGGGRGLAVLLVALVVIWGAVVGLGFLVTEVFRGWLHDVDLTVARWFADIRTDALTDLLVTLGHLGGSVGIVAALLVAVPLSLALTRRWTPGLFLVVAVVGETALFMASAAVVGRPRPPVDKIAGVLPPTASFPSGHVAAALAAYGAMTLLVWAWSSGRSQGWVRAAALLVASAVVVVVAVSRLYRGMHWLTDVVASVLYASAWLWVCWRVLQPGPRPPHRGAASAREKDR